MVSRDWLEKDFYKVLGVTKDAPSSDIKKAYRKLARDLHPDHNPGNADAEERFKEVSEAYAVLSDDRQRAEYDEMRSLMGAGAFRRGARMGQGGMPFDFDDLMAQARGGGFGGGGNNGGLGDLFGSFFGGGRRRGPTKGRDVETGVVLEFDDSVKGVALPLKLRSPGVCDLCHGSGAKPGTSPKTCPTCQGAGVRTVNQGAFSLSEPCRECDGVGTVIVDKCPECQGTGGVTKTRTMTVRIPAGVKSGQRIRLAGRGEPGTRGGAAGDLYVLVTVRPHPLFARDGDNLALTVPVSFTEAALGVNLRIPTLDGPVTLRVPPGTPSGRTLRVRGRGVNRDNGKGGDLLVTIEVHVPKDLTPEARKALEEYAQAAPAAPRDEIERAAAAPTG
ncbi:molecular chaperone DnaJ [Stackebrandtia albiflava]|uniref:Chaperone protein DnaJ n=1 Tax=Stackebrandtia albiflava TaxID=406432 RepID=A0A562V0I7_9ACTN|nr:molecular chaperone DnaJ [Stackebrandtia albiflava]TWJ11450.1 molecular chaperone DnaJ [Stackebrandtia albiflava]